MKKLQLFDQNHGLSPLEICQFCIHLKCMFILSRKACLYLRVQRNNTLNLECKEVRDQSLENLDFPVHFL